MTSILGLIDPKVRFEAPGSRIAVVLVPFRHGRTSYIREEWIEVSDKNTITSRGFDPYLPKGDSTPAQPRVVHEGGHGMPGPKLVPRSEGRTARWTDTSNEGTLKSWDWPFPKNSDAWPIEYKRMREPVPTQAVLMDEFTKEAQDDARYNAVPTNTVRSKVEHI